MNGALRIRCNVTTRLRAGARRGAVACALIAVCAMPAISYAQCVMCGKNAEYAGGEPGRAYATLATAALVLLVPMLTVVGGLAAYVWKHRH